MNQDQFDLGQAEQCKEDGMAKAREAQSAIEWQQDVARWFFSLPLGSVFILDDLVRACGLPSPEPGPNKQNLVGSWINGMAKARFIRWTGRMVKSERVKRHAGEAKQWQ